MHDDPVEHFKYGSIGSDVETGFPLHVMEVLPTMFPEYLPEGAPHDWTAFGLYQEEGHSMPIGFSERTRIVPLTGLTCAACHSGVWRAGPDAEPMRILGMPNAAFDVQAMFVFLFNSVRDDRFTADNVIAAMEERGTEVSAIDRIVYRRVVPRMRERLLEREAVLQRLFSEDHPPFGPGRVAAFNSFKLDLLAEHYAGGISEEEAIGTADYASTWNQGIRDNWQLNWDGNSPVTLDRNVGAAMGAGATPTGIDLPNIARVTEYLATLAPPPYPYHIDREQAARGEVLFRQHCNSCHGVDGERVGQTTPIDEIGTDRRRFDSFTPRLIELLQAFDDGYDWSLSSFRKTDGYANSPLDGIWARGPYLHNGSVPTLWDLLTPAEQRNGGATFFYTGHTVLDTVDVGSRADVARVGARPSFRYDLTLPGNSNVGHTGPYYGTELTDEEKRALIEYMKTL